MRYRRATLLAEESQATDGTKTIDKFGSDVISRIQIALKTTKSKNAMDDHPAADATKIELVDGSDVLWSMSGKSIQALGYYQGRVPVHNYYNCYGTVQTHARFCLNFGRRLFDRELGWDPTRFKNPQLKITHSKIVSDTGGTALTLKVIADIFDELKPSPTGFLAAKDYYDYVCGAAGAYEYVDIPTDRILRSLIVRPYRAVYEPMSQVDQIKLSEDNDKRIPYDIDSLEDYVYEKEAEWPLITEDMWTTFDVGTTYRYFQPTQDFVVLCKAVGAATTGYPNATPRGGRYPYVQGSPGQECHLIASGYLPHHAVQLPFGDPDVIEDWYDPTALTSLEMRLRAGSSGTTGKCVIITEQLRKY